MSGARREAARLWRLRRLFAVVVENSYPFGNAAEDESPLGSRQAIFHPYILHGTYWYQSGCFRGNEGNSVPARPLMPPEPLGSLAVASP